MRAAPEIYKGIEYVRIFSLPDEQKTLLRQTFSRDKIIKILKENSLLSDCIQYTDYVRWYDLNFRTNISAVKIEPQVMARVLTPVTK